MLFIYGGVAAAHAAPRWVAPSHTYIYAFYCLGTSINLDESYKMTAAALSNTGCSPDRDNSKNLRNIPIFFIATNNVRWFLKVKAKNVENQLSDKTS